MKGSSGVTMGHAPPFTPYLPPIAPHLTLDCAPFIAKPSSPPPPPPPQMKVWAPLWPSPSLANPKIKTQLRHCKEVKRLSLHKQLETF